MSFWGWQGDHLCLPMSPDPCGRAQQSPKSAVGEAQSKGQDRALSQHPPRSASSQTSPRRAGQLRRDHASPARSLLLPPGKSSCSPPLSALPNPGLGAEPRSPPAWWRCRDPAAEPGCAGSHRGSDRLLSLQITPGFLFAFPHASLEHRWSIPPSSAAAALATTAPASPPAAAPLKISPQSKCWRGLWCPLPGGSLAPDKAGVPKVWGASSTRHPPPHWVSAGSWEMGHSWSLRETGKRRERSQAEQRPGSVTRGDGPLCWSHRRGCRRGSCTRMRPRCRVWVLATGATGHSRAVPKGAGPPPAWGFLHPTNHQLPFWH